MKKRKIFMYFFKIFGIGLFFVLVALIDYREFLVNANEPYLSIMFFSVSVIHLLYFYYLYLWLFIVKNIEYQSI